MIEYIGLSSLLILAVIVLRALVGGRVSQRVRYGLWLLVALRLLIPFQVGSSALSLVPVLREVQGLWGSQAAKLLSGSGAGELPAEKENGQPGVVVGENGRSGTADGEDSPFVTADGSANQRNAPAEKDGRPGSAGTGNRLFSVTDGKGGEFSVSSEKNGKLSASGLKDGQPADMGAAGKNVSGAGRTGNTGGPSVWIWLSLWLSGAILAGGCLVWANLRFWIRIKRERYRLPDVPGYLPVYGASCVQTPCLYGLFRPAIYLPADIAEVVLAGGHGYSDNPAWDAAWIARREVGVPNARLTHILAHEQTHYSHYDHVWAFVRCLCLTIHWYNPLVWAAASLSRRDSELACDEGAVRRLGEASRKAYGATLIEVAAGGRETARSAICFTCLWNGKKEMEKRLHTLVRRPRTTAGTAVLAAILMVLFAGCAFSNPAENGSGGDGNSSQSGGVSLAGDDRNREKDDSASGQNTFGGGDGRQDAGAAGAGDLAARPTGAEAAGGSAADEAEEPSVGTAGEKESPASAEPSGVPDDGEVYLLDEPVEGKVCIAVNPVNMHPPSGRYFHISHQEGWRSNWEEGTGYGPENAYTYYYVPEDSVQAGLQQMMAKLDGTKGIPEGSENGSRMIGYSLWYEGKTWDVYEDGSLYWYQSDDDTLEVTEALEENAALCDTVARLLKEKLGYEPVDLDQIQDITSATMVYTERRGGKEDVPQSQTVTDPDVLRQIEALIRQARYLHGGSGCSFYEAVLTVTLASGEEIRMAVASDSCAVFLVNGMYYDYQPEGNSGQLFRYFDRISVYGLEDETDT